MKRAVAIRPNPIGDDELASTDAAETVAAWSSGTIYTAGDQARSDTTHRIYESAIGEAKGAATVSIASPAVVSFAAHGLAANGTVAFATTGALPTGLAANTVYYVRNPSADAFELAATSGGASINTSGSQSGTHTLYSDPNLGIDPTLEEDESRWLDAAPTNGWAMFDAINGTTTTRGDGLTVTVAPGRTDSLGLEGLVGSAVAITVNDGTSDVYSRSIGLVQYSGGPSWYGWLFAPRTQKRSLLLTDLPAVLEPQITIALTGPAGEDVAIGTAAFGRQLDIGTPERGLQNSFRSFSTKEANDLGVYTVVKRANSKKITARLLIENTRIDHVIDELGQLDAVPIFWGISDSFDAARAFGFFKQLDSEISWSSTKRTLVTLQIEGVT